MIFIISISLIRSGCTFRLNIFLRFNYDDDVNKIENAICKFRRFPFSVACLVSPNHLVHTFLVAQNENNTNSAYTYKYTIDSKQRAVYNWIAAACLHLGMWCAWLTVHRQMQKSLNWLWIFYGLYMAWKCMPSVRAANNAMLWRTCVQCTNFFESEKAPAAQSIIYLQIVVSGVRGRERERAEGAQSNISSTCHAADEIWQER